MTPRTKRIITIARALHSKPDTIFGVVRIHGRSKRYRAYEADQTAWTNALRPKDCKLVSRLCQFITDKLQKKWSPEQIAGGLRQQFPYDEQRQVFHETIYKSLYVQARGVLKKELMEYLRAGHKMRQTKRHSTQSDRGDPWQSTFREKLLVNGRNQFCIYFRGI